MKRTLLILLPLLLMASPVSTQSATIQPSAGGPGWRTDTGQIQDLMVPMTWTSPYYGGFLCLPWPVGMFTWPYAGP